jgi:hypothetical protein
MQARDSEDINLAVLCKIDALKLHIDAKVLIVVQKKAKETDTSHSPHRKSRTSLQQQSSF